MKVVNIKNIAAISAIALLSIGFSGCGAAAKNFKVSADYQKSLSKGNSLAIMTDVCLRMDEVGEDTDHFSAYKSKKVADLITKATSDRLTKSGYSIGYIENRTMCDFYKRPTPSTNFIANEGDQLGKGALPYFHNEIENKEYQEAIHKVLYRAALSANKNNFSNIFFADQEITKDIKTIKDISKQNKLLVLAVRAGEVSSGKAMGQGIKAAFIGGRVSVDFLQTHALMIDLDNNKAIWTALNVIKKADLYNEAFYNDDYYSQVIESLEKL